MSRQFLLSLGFCFLAIASLSILSPFLGFIGAILSFAFLLHNVRSLEENKSKIENVMLVEDNRIAKVVCDSKENILTYNNKGGEFFGTGQVFEKIKERLYKEDSNNIEAFNKISLSVIRGANTTEAISFGKSGEETYLIEVRAILGRNIWLISAEDITALKNIDTSLRQERYDIGEFFDYLPIALYCTNKEGNIVFTNARFCEYIGYSSQAILSKNIKDLIENGSPDFTNDWHGNVIFRTANGSSFKAFLSHSISTDEESLIRGAITLNASEGSEEQEETKHLIKRLNNLFTESPFGIAFTDSEGRLKEINPALNKMFGTVEEQIIGEKIIDCVDEKHSPEFKEKIEKVMSGALPNAKCEIQIKKQDSLFEAELAFTVFIFPTHIVSYNNKRKINGLLLHFFDITEWKNLEVQFEQAQKMQAMGQLAGGIAHDLNNILTAILGFCDLLMQRHGPGDPSFSDIFQIQQNSSRAANFVRRLLAFTRQQPFVPKITDTTEAFAEITDLLRQLIGSNIEMKVNYGRNLGYIRIDQGHFEQIFMNLTVNARDAMHGKGIISINISNYEVTEPIPNETDIIPTGKYVMFEFKDTGCGIKKEHIKRIFEPFFSTKSETGSGTGLGLATVYGIIRQTEGFIRVESAVGKGTKFTILLPHYEEPEQKPEDREEKSLPLASEKEKRTIDIIAPSAEQLSFTEESEKQAPSKQRGNILLAEDEAGVRLFSSRALKNKGYNVVACSCAGEALEVLESNQDFDLLITDMTMPGMDGATLAKEVQKIIPEIRIIIMSGFSEDIAKGIIADNPEIHFLGKPFNLKQITNKVKEVLT